MGTDEMRRTTYQQEREDNATKEEPFADLERNVDATVVITLRTTVVDFV